MIYAISDAIQVTPPRLYTLCSGATILLHALCIRHTLPTTLSTESESQLVGKT
jgi:hypothetical protein